MMEFQHTAAALEIDTAESWRSFLRTTPYGLLVVEADGTIAFANIAAARQFGYEIDELQGETVELLIPERFRAGHVAIRERYLQDPAPRPPGRVLFGRRKSGREFPVDLGLAPVCWSGRRAVACTTVDLTERIQSDLLLSESESRFREILDNTSAVVYVKFVNGSYAFVNREFERLFSLNRETLTGMTDAEIFPPEMAAAFRTNDLKVIETGTTLKIDEVAPSNDGPHTYVSVKFPLRRPDGTIYAVAGISTDITDRVRAERELAELKRSFERILQSISDGEPRPIEFRVGPIHENETNLGSVFTLRDVADKKAREALEHEVASARTVQQALLPRQPPQIPGFDVAGRVIPASALCGDYLDFVDLGDGRHVFVVGDVSGHGFGPAIQMVEARAYLRALLRTEPAPGEVLRKLNRLLYPDVVEGSFVTLFLAVLDTRIGEVTYSAAGHEGWVFDAAGDESRLRSLGLPLGLVEDADYEECVIPRLESGDLLVLMTDGVFETLCPKGTLFGWPRTAELIREHRHLSAARMIERIHGATRVFAQSPHCKDDLSLAVVKAL